MNERVKQIRLHFNLTQEEFGKKLGVTRSAISYIESGRSKLTDQMLFMICITFDVRQEWLKTGSGNIFITHTAGEELAAYMGKLFAEEDPEKERYALIALKLIVDEWDLVCKNIATFGNILSWIDEKPKKSEMP